MGLLLLLTVWLTFAFVVYLPSFTLLVLLGYGFASLLFFVVGCELICVCCVVCVGFQLVSWERLHK